MANGYKGLRMSGRIKPTNMGNIRVQKGVDFIELAERGLITGTHEQTSTAGAGHKKNDSRFGSAISSSSVDMGRLDSASGISYDYGSIATAALTEETDKWAVRRSVATSRAAIIAAANAAPVYSNYDWNNETSTRIFSQNNAGGRFKIPSTSGGGAIFSPTASGAGWQFGRAVAQSDDYYVVGASSLWYNNLQNLGAVFVYRKSDNALLHTIQPPLADQVQGMGFGADLEMHGNKILIRAGEDSRLYDAVTGNVIHVFTPTLLGGGSQQYWGISAIAMTENYSIMSSSVSDAYGSPNKAWVFDNSTGAIVHIVEEQDAVGVYPNSKMFGLDCAMNDDYFAVACMGAIYADRALSANGYVEIYNMSDGTIARRLELPTTETAAINDFFGKRIDIDGNRIAVSCPGKDTMYIFDLTDGSLLHTVTGLTTNASIPVNQRITNISLSGNAVAINYCTSGTIVHVEVVDIATSIKLQSFTSIPIESTAGSNYPSNYFGYSIHLLDGELIVGSSAFPSAYQENKGEIYRYIAPVIAD